MFYCHRVPPPAHHSSVSASSFLVQFSSMNNNSNKYTGWNDLSHIQQERNYVNTDYNSWILMLIFKRSQHLYIAYKKEVGLTQWEFRSWALCFTVTHWRHRVKLNLFVFRFLFVYPQLSSRSNAECTGAGSNLMVCSQPVADRLTSCVGSSAADSVGCNETYVPRKQRRNRTTFTVDQVIYSFLFAPPLGRFNPCISEN